ncbi:MAG: 16S rRNA (cytosine(1402)-N(4))-methyltransferase RsmH, partial [Pyrinomonadaceae bacterium]
LDETLGLLGNIDGGIVVDCTLGFGGHSLAILERFPNLKIVAIDQDKAALSLVRPRFEQFKSRIQFVHSNFSEIKTVIEETVNSKVNAIIADLGVSSMQLDSETRGFSFRFDAPLDMRMDMSANTPTAAQLLSTMTEFEIADVIYRYGEERHSRKIARRIVGERDAGRPVLTTKELAGLVERSVPRNKKHKIHPATRTFQALRIKVNGELEILEGFLGDSIEMLETDGVLAVITFHSLEDRIVKTAFQRFAGKCICPPKIPQCVCGAKKIAELVTRKPIVPSETEQARNPRSRSAKLRAVKKLSN